MSHYVPMGQPKYNISKFVWQNNLDNLLTTATYATAPISAGQSTTGAYIYHQSEHPIQFG